MSEIPRSRNPDEVPEYTVPAEDLYHFGDTVHEIPDQTTPYYEKPDVHEPGVGESEPSLVKPELDANTARRVAIIEKYPEGYARSTLIGLAHQLKAGNLYNSQALRADMAQLAHLTNQDEVGVRHDFNELANLLAADEQELAVASPDSFPSDQPPARQDIITSVPGISGDAVAPVEGASGLVNTASSEELAPEPKNDSDRFIDDIRGKLASYPEVLEMLEDAYSDVTRLTNENRSDDTVLSAEESWREKLKNAGSIYGVPKDSEHSLDRMFTTYMNHRGFAK